MMESVLISAGVISIIYGLIGLVLRRSVLFGGNTKKYTVESVKLFAGVSGVTELILGGIVCAIIFAASDTIHLLGAAILWIEIASLLTMYLCVLKKERK